MKIKMSVISLCIFLTIFSLCGCNLKSTDGSTPSSTPVPQPTDICGDGEECSIHHFQYHNVDGNLIEYVGTDRMDTYSSSHRGEAFNIVDFVQEMGIKKADFMACMGITEDNWNDYLYNSSYMILNGEYVEAIYSGDQAKIDAVFTRKMVHNQPVPFTVSLQVRGYANYYFSNTTGLKGYVIRSPEELQEKLPEKWEAIIAQSEIDISAIAPERFTTTFFREKSLVLLRITEPSGSIRFVVDELIADGSTLSVHYTATRPTPVTDDIAYWYVLLEVNREDVEGMLIVEGIRTEVTLPSGEKLP